MSEATTLLAADPGSSQQPPASSTPPPSAWNWAAEDGKFSEGWQDKLADDVKGHESLRAIGTIHDLAKSYVHTKGMVGKKLEMPAHDAPPEALAHWRKVTGAPDAPEGYLGEAKTLRPEDFPAEHWDAEGEKAFLALAHKHSLPPAVVKDIIAFDAGRLKGALGKSKEQEAAVLSEQKAILQKEWGNDYQAKVNVAARFAATLGLKSNNPIFTNAEVVKAFVQGASLISEDRLVKGDASVNLGGSIRERIAEIQNPQSTSQNSRAYRGELGPEAQAEAQRTLHNLMDALSKQ